MKGLKTLIELLKQESGKIFVIDESGEPQFVILNLAEYEKLKNSPSMLELADRLQSLTRQTEELNEAITSAQMEDWSDLEDAEIGEKSAVRESESYYIEPIEEKI